MTSLPALRSTSHPHTQGSFSAKGLSVHALRDIPSHAARRKYWDRGFSGAALSEYTPRIIEKGEFFVSRLKQISQNGPVDISEWTNYLLFDIMGELGFGQSFEMV